VLAAIPVSENPVFQDLGLEAVFGAESRFMVSLEGDCKPVLRTL